MAPNTHLADIPLCENRPTPAAPSSTSGSKHRKSQTTTRQQYTPLIAPPARTSLHAPSLHLEPRGFESPAAHRHPPRPCAPPPFGASHSLALRRSPMPDSRGVARLCCFHVFLRFWIWIGRVWWDRRGRMVDGQGWLVVGHGCEDMRIAKGDSTSS